MKIIIFYRRKKRKQKNEIKQMMAWYRYFVILYIGTFIIKYSFSVLRLFFFVFFFVFKYYG